jgi:hypothetical protein
MFENEIPLDQLASSIYAMGDKVRQEVRTALVNSGRMMSNAIKLRFATGSGPYRDRWLSTAYETKFGSRWSTEYWRKSKASPDGELTQGSIRLFWTGGLMRSFAVLEQTDENVLIGPTGTNPDGVEYAIIADHAAEHWDNYIVGWDDESLRWVEMELKALSQRVLTGNSLV